MSPIHREDTARDVLAVAFPAPDSSEQRQARTSVSGRCRARRDAWVEQGPAPALPRFRGLRRRTRGCAQAGRGSRLARIVLPRQVDLSPLIEAQAVGTV